MRLGTRRKETEDVAPEVYPVEPEDTSAMPDHSLHIEGETCARCGRAITAHDEVRRSAKGGYVHHSC